VPVSLTPRPQPGDLITAEWMDRLARANEDLYGQIEVLSRRLAVLEQGGGKQGPEILHIDPNKFRVFVDRIRTDDRILEVADPAARLEKVRDLWLAERENTILDENVKSAKEVTSAEWMLLGPAAGIAPSNVSTVLATSRPDTAAAVNIRFGDTAHELDTFANLSTGLIGLR